MSLYPQMTLVTAGSGDYGPTEDQVMPPPYVNTAIPVCVCIVLAALGLQWQS